MTNEEESKRIGQKIEAMRKEAGLNIQELADRAGIGRSHLSRIEDGKYDVRLSVLASVANALGGSIEIVKGN